MAAINLTTASKLSQTPFCAPIRGPVWTPIDIDKRSATTADIAALRVSGTWACPDVGTLDRLRPDGPGSGGQLKQHPVSGPSWMKTGSHVTQILQIRLKPAFQVALPILFYRQPPSKLAPY